MLRRRTPRRAAAPSACSRSATAPCGGNARSEPSAASSGKIVVSWSPCSGSARSPRRREHVDAAVDPVRQLRRLVEAGDDSSSSRSTRPNCDGGLRDGDGRGRAARAMPREQRCEVDVDAARRRSSPARRRLSRAVPGGEADPASAAERLRLADADDLDAEAGEVVARTPAPGPAAQLTITRVDARAAQPADLAARAAACPRPARATSGVPRAASPSRSALPPARTIASISRQLPSRRARGRCPRTRSRPRAAPRGRACCARRSGAACASSRRAAAQSSAASCGHSVTITAASAPAQPPRAVSRRLDAVQQRRGRRRRDPRRARRRPRRAAAGEDEARRLAHVVRVRLEREPEQRDRLPRSEPRCCWSFPITRRFCSSFTSITAFSSWKW